MILYVIYVEPFLLSLRDNLPGFSLSAPLKNQVPHLLVEGAKEIAEGFLDYVEVLITSDEEFLLLEEIVLKFARLRSRSNFRPGSTPAPAPGNISKPAPLRLWLQ